MSVKEVSRITVVDDAGNSMSFVVALNGTAYKVYAEAMVDGAPKRSNIWIVVDLDRAKKLQRGKVDDAIADGWREAPGPKDDI